MAALSNSVELESYSVQLNAISDKLIATFDGRPHLMELGDRVGKLGLALQSVAWRQLEAAAMRKEQETAQGIAQVKAATMRSGHPHSFPVCDAYATRHSCSRAVL